MTAEGTADSQVDIRRSRQRFHTEISWLNSHHSFSFAEHYDPRNTHHGLLLVSNDDVVKPNTGFRTHPHRDMEIVTWVGAEILIWESNRDMEF
jgi:redox-sensitive bicupin YhaK (pirin superfamily)